MYSPELPHSSAGAPINGVTPGDLVIIKKSDDVMAHLAKPFSQNSVFFLFRQQCKRTRSNHFCPPNLVTIPSVETAM